VAGSAFSSAQWPVRQLREEKFCEKCVFFAPLAHTVPFFASIELEKASVSVPVSVSLRLTSRITPRKLLDTFVRIHYQLCQRPRTGQLYCQSSSMCYNPARQIR